jgi:NAD(P)-dependent dehydrogenase (short-subunit alcohol dehydrogenase family)
MGGPGVMSGRPWALILGVTGGTGQAIARAVARDPGLNVLGLHRGHFPERAAELEESLPRMGAELRMIVRDAGRAEAAEQTAIELLESLGPRSIKLYVHAIAQASVGRFTSAGEDRLHPQQIRRSFEAMAHSFVYWAQELSARDLLAPEARLLALSNPMADAVVSGTGIISACKAALGAYVRHLAHELGPRGHRVNLLQFGAVTTAAVSRTFGGPDGVNRLQDILERAIPARRLCTADEVARFVGVLAGEAGAWFNGATIDFTGGEFQGLMNVLLGKRGETSS